MKHRRLQELKRSDFEIVDDQPDIRGWDVRLANGDKVGKVRELIVDAQQKKVRYMVLDTHKNKLNLDDRRLLVPIGMAELHKEDDDVILPHIQTSQLQQLPDYQEDKLDGDVERQICSVFGRTGMTQGSQGLHAGGNTSMDGKHSAWVEGMEPEPEPEFYKHDYYNDDNLYRHRLHEAQSKSQESEYERGLRLWERRSGGGIITDSGSGSVDSRSERERPAPSHESSRQRTEERAMEPVKRTRSTNRTTDSDRSSDNDRSSQSGKRNRERTIEDRIRREGLQE